MARGAEAVGVDAGLLERDRISRAHFGRAKITPWLTKQDGTVASQETMPFAFSQLPETATANDTAAATMAESECMMAMMDLSGDNVERNRQEGPSYEGWNGACSTVSASGVVDSCTSSPFVSVLAQVA
ncbi:hypothetical protein MMC27_001409 [Xylographa pallens]|nr:hypothetical protein [Xylographa pallens]